MPYRRLPSQKSSGYHDRHLLKRLEFSLIFSLLLRSIIIGPFGILEYGRLDSNR